MGSSFAGPVLAAIAVIGGLLGFASCTSVQAGHAGVVSLFGDVSEKALPPGAHILNPLASVTDMDCRILRDSRKQGAASKDMQDVSVEIGINYHLDPAQAARIYREIGADWSDRIIPNAESETLKAEIAHHVASDILQNRVAIKERVEAALAKWLAKYGIVLDEVAIANIDFSEDYENAIERKQVEEQTALQKVYELQTAQKAAEIAKAKASGEADAAIETARGAAESILVRATAQAEANRKLSESLSGDAGLRILTLQQIERWNGIMPTTVAGDRGFSLILGAQK